jgi:hypothetical protein
VLGLTVLALGLAVLALGWRTADDWDYAAILGGLLVALGGGLVVRGPRARPDPGAAALRDAAELLADRVHEQWDRELGKRRLRHPRPLGLRWTLTAEPRLLASARTGSLIVDGGGRAPAARLVRAFRRLPAPQLVIRGAAGSGKSTLAMLFTVAALAESRSPHRTGAGAALVAAPVVLGVT